MAEAEAWYLDFRTWRIRRSPLEGAKLVLRVADSQRDLPGVWWELRSFARALGFTGRTWQLCAWWRRYEEKQVQELFEQVGIGAGEVRLSKRALEHRRADAAPDDVAAGGDQEMTVTTRALLLLLGRWATSSAGVLAKKANATAMLHDVISFVAALSAAQYRAQLEVPAAAIGHECSRAATIAGEPCRHCGDIYKQVGHPSHFAVAATQWSAQVDLVIGLMRMQSQCVACQIWLKVVVNVISTNLDAILLGHQVGQATPEGIPQPRGLKRALRIDPEIRRVACRTAVAEGRFRNPQAMSRSGAIDLPESTAGKLNLGYAADYHWSCFAALRTQRFVHISLDATTVGGEETMAIAFWAAASGKAGWLIPQVGLRMWVRSCQS